MPKFKITPHLGLFFIIAVVIPSALLVLISLRAVNREEAYIEKSLKDTLMVEVTHLAGLVRAELDNIEQELADSVPVMEGNLEWAFLRWQSNSSLVDVGFLLSPDKELIWPRLAQAMKDEQKRLISQNIDFLEDKVKVPVYQDIASAYQDEILSLSQEQSLSQQETRTSAAATENFDADLARGHQELSDAQVASAPQRQRVYPESNDWSALNQMARSQIQRDEPLREQVYKQAAEEGQQISERVVRFSGKRLSKGKALPVKKSSFIAEPMNFGAITARRRQGLIPRFIDNQLRLIFWKKMPGGRIAGCVLNAAKLKDRIVGLLPDIYTPARLITVLDEGARPLIVPPEAGRRDWRLPFVAWEISELLPRWEVAAYLTDPGAISARARFMAAVMWTLILILFSSIASGGFLVLKALHSEMTLASQKTTFVANVSHELKTPLTSIRMFAEILKEGRQPDEEKKHKYLSLMVSETERLTRLINNVLDFSRRKSGKKSYNPAQIDIVLLVENIIESQRPRLEHNGFKLGFQSELGRVEVTADEEAIKQALLNLLSNAEKYASQKKEIDVEITRVDSQVLISIKDRGIGVSGEHAAKIFKEFYRVDDALTSRARGTGLGLTISQQIIQDHAGEISYFPRDGGGSVFQIKLPIKESA